MTLWDSPSSSSNDPSIKGSWKRSATTWCHDYWKTCRGNQAPYLHRFVIVFDREGYRPAFFKEMWHTHRIACTTYHKYPKDPWPETEFRRTEITLANGERVSMTLAERGSWIGSRRDGL